MSGWVWAALIVIAACAGTLTALLAAAMARYDAGVAELDAQVDAERAQRHRAGVHVRRGGRGDCVVCGLREGGA